MASSRKDQDRYRIRLTEDLRKAHTEITQLDPFVAELGEQESRGKARVKLAQRK